MKVVHPEQATVVWISQALFSSQRGSMMQIRYAVGPD